MAFPLAENITTISELAVYADTVAGGWVGTGLNLVLFFVILMYSIGRNRDTAESIAGACVMVVFQALAFYYVGITSEWELFAWIMFAGVTAGYLYTQ